MFEYIDHFLDYFAFILLFGIIPGMLVRGNLRLLINIGKQIAVWLPASYSDVA